MECGRRTCTEHAHVMHVQEHCAHDHNPMHAVGVPAPMRTHTHTHQRKGPQPSGCTVPKHGPKCQQ